MGNCVTSEEKNISKHGMMAVSSTTNQIDDDVLNMALEATNPLKALKSKVTLNFSAENLSN